MQCTFRAQVYAIKVVLFACILNTSWKYGELGPLDPQTLLSVLTRATLVYNRPSSNGHQKKGLRAFFRDIARRKDMDGLELIKNRHCCGVFPEIMVRFRVSGVRDPQPYTLTPQFLVT